MKYLLMLGCTFAIAISANSALANSITHRRGSANDLVQIAQTPKISQENQSPEIAKKLAQLDRSRQKHPRNAEDEINRGDSHRELYRLCKLAQRGNGNTLYYSNGQVMTHWAGRDGQTWYYPNGRVMTNWSGRDGQTWYYSNGQVMTNWVGREGQTWYHPNGKVMTNWVGRDGQTWYHPNGQIMTSSGNLISEEEMLYPCSYIR